MNRKDYIFISYSHDNFNEVEKITQLFDNNNIEYWIDYKSIRLGAKYQGDIVRGIESCEIFLFVYSSKTNQSKDQIKELGIASDANRRIIPFMLDNSEWGPDLRYMARSNQGIEAWKTGMDFALKVLINGINNYQVEDDSPYPNKHLPLQSITDTQEDIVDLDYEDALVFFQNNELQNAICSLQISFENGNNETTNLFNKILFQNFGNIEWNKRSWSFFEEQAKNQQSFAHLAYFYKFLHNRETYPQAWQHVRSARLDRKNGYAILCEGIAYQHGIGMNPNLTIATNRYKSAFEMNIWESCSYLAEMYLNGNSGAKANKNDAIKVLAEGQKHDDARSWFVTGSIYEDKAHIKENWEKAVTNYRKAVELHMHEAWIKLGDLYNYNRFSEDYKDEALSCYLEALKNGNKDAHAYIAMQYWDKDRQEDAIIEAQKGEKVGNVLSISTLGKFYEEGLQEEGHWIRDPKPDFAKAWEYYRKAFLLGGNIKDAISMARLYVRDEYLPEGISWETIQGYLEEGARVPIEEAVELMIEALRKNGKEKEMLKYLKIGADSGSLSMKHEYGVRLLSTDNGASLSLIEEAGGKGYQPSVEWLIQYYKKVQTYSKKDYEKWMEIGADMGIDVSPDDYIPYLVENEPEKAKKYLLEKYPGDKIKYLIWIYKYHLVLNIDKQWLLSEFKSNYSNNRGKLSELCEPYAVFMLRSGLMTEYETFCDDISSVNPDEGHYYTLLRDVFEAKGLNKALAIKIKNFSKDKSIHSNLRMRSRILLLNHLSDKNNSKILIADGKNSNVLLLKILFTNWGYDVYTANTGESCLELAQRECPDVILLDILLPDINGFDVASRLKDDPATKHIPFIFLWASNSPFDYNRGYQSGAADFLSKPFNKEELYCRVTHQLILSKLAKLTSDEAENVKGKKKIMIVDDNEGNLLLIKTLFNIKQKYDVCTAESGFTCIETANEEIPDMIILDIMMPGLDGFDTAAVLKENPKTCDIPILFLTALNNPQKRGFEVGGTDFLAKPFHPKDLLARVEKILTVNELISKYLNS